MCRQYSVCITCRNNINTIRESMKSVLNQIDNTFEVVVVDAESNDGTTDILREYADKTLIRLIVKKCSRGMGRQIAFENSKGEYVIANMDLDDVFEPNLRELLSFYKNHCEGKILLAIKGDAQGIRELQSITIGSRKLISELGGWRDLQWAEDWDLWSRAAKSGRFAWTIFPIARITNPHLERQQLKSKFLFRYVKYREMLSLGRHIFNPEEKIALNQKLALWLAGTALIFRRRLSDEFNKIFNPYDPRYYIESAYARTNLQG